MEETPLITKIVACRRVVHDEPGVKPSVRIRAECRTEAGPLVVLITPPAANDLAAKVKRLRTQDK